MMTLIFGIAYKYFDLDDDLQIGFAFFAFFDGLCAWAVLDTTLRYLILNK